MYKGTRTLVVTRTRTASRAMLAALGGDPDDDEIGKLTVCPMGRLHREGTWFHALMIGEPSPWDWHRLLSGLRENLEILTLGSHSATGCARKVDEVRCARDHWGGTEVRGHTWHDLLRCDPAPVISPGGSHAVRASGSTRAAYTCSRGAAMSRDAVSGRGIA